MEQPHDAGMLAALALGPGTRLAVIDSFVHRDGILYLAAEPGSIGPDGTVDAARLGTVISTAGARVLAVHTSSAEVAARPTTDVPVPHSYEAVLDAALLAECDGLILHSGSSWIVLARTEVKSALTRRRRLATRAATKESGVTAPAGEPDLALT